MSDKITKSQPVHWKGTVPAAPDPNGNRAQRRSAKFNKRKKATK